MKFAAIDLGSNAVRLLISHVHHQISEKPVFKKASLVRVPLRLGEDVFRLGYLEAETIQRLVKTMQAFKLLIEVQEPLSFRACATSAMREAKNAAEVVKRIRDETGIVIDVISGDEEAQLIYENHIEEHLDPSRVYLYIDVGGGSTELTLYRNGACVAGKSFDIGTLRILAGGVSEAMWEHLKEWVSRHTEEISEPIYGIGSGGNINKLRGMVLNKKNNKPLSYNDLMGVYEKLNAASYDERLERFGLNPDRADVIVPACEIYFAVMDAARIEKMYVPEIGLADGIVHLLYAEHLRQALRI
jgi:exopolyphosphatase / guanosine-5'-triphosphate,3'-diphosphate pyrophosphatase